MNTASPYILGLYEKAMPLVADWPAKLNAAREAGFDFVEISIDETDDKLSRLDWSPLQRWMLIRQMDAAGIRIETMCLSGHRRYPLGSPDPQKRKKSLEIMQQAVNLAADLGIRIIQLAGYDTYYDPSTEETREHFLAGLVKSVEFASRSGIILGFETMETPFMNTVGKAMAFVDQIQSPYLQVYPDIGNLTNAALSSGTPVAVDLLSGKGHIAAVHLKETVPGLFREIPFGTGHVDFASLIPLAYSMGIRRYTAEFWHKGETDWQSQLRQTAEFLRAFFRKAVQAA